MGRVSGVSVIIPAFNGSEWICGAVESVLQQLCDVDLEVIVVDDDSKDDTVEKVSQIPDDRVRVIRSAKNQGTAAARNLGVSHARHEWIAFNDQDDIWLPTKLSLQLDLLDRYPDMQAVAGGAGRLAADGRSEWSANILGWKWRPRHSLALRHPPYFDPRVDGTTYLQTLLVAREVAMQIGLFKPTLPLSDDLDFFVRLAERVKIGFVDDALFLYRLGTHNQTAPTQLSAHRFLASHAYYKECARARMEGRMEPSVEDFFSKYVPSESEVRAFLIGQQLRHVNTVWVNNGGLAALAAIISATVRSPYYFGSYLISRVFWWVRKS